jgi:hypothetical protein
MRRTVGPFTLAELATGHVCFDIVSAIVTIVSWIAGAIVDVAAATWAAFIYIWQALKPFFVDVWHVVRPIWDSVLKPFWGKLKGWFTQLKTWWDRWAKPVKDFLSKVEAFERTIYDATFGPIFDTISNLQKLLVLLHLSHTALGQALHDAFQQVDTWVTTVYNVVTQPINSVIAKIDGYILDIDGFLSAPLLAVSITNHFRTIWSEWWIKALPQVSADAQQVLEAAKLHQTVADHRKIFKLGAVPESPLAPAYDHGRAVLMAIANFEEPPIVTEQDDGTFV